MKDAKKDVPGPNQYKIHSSLSKIAFSMAKKTELSSERVSPGPASYVDPISQSNWTKGMRIGTQERFKEPRQRIRTPTANMQTATSARPSTTMTTDHVIGPFGYEVEESYRKTVRNISPSFGF